MRVCVTRMNSTRTFVLLLLFFSVVTPHCDLCETNWVFIVGVIGNCIFSTFIFFFYFPHLVLKLTLQFVRLCTSRRQSPTIRSYVTATIIKPGHSGSTTLQEMLNAVPGIYLAGDFIGKFLAFFTTNSLVS